MGEVVNELTVVTKLRDLSADPANQPYIVRRNILPTLVKFLTNKDPQVVLRAAETLRFLSSHQDNPDYMCREKGLVQAVVKLYQSTPDATLKAVVADIMRNLHAAIKKEGGGASPPASPAQARPEGGEVPMPASPPPKDPEYVVMLEVWDNTLRCDEVEKAVLPMKGVLSCVALPESRAVRVVTRLDGNDIVEHLKRQGMSVQVADQKPHTKDDGGDVDGEYRKSLVAAGENSLAARLKRQREERLKEREARVQQESTMSRFFRKVTSGMSLW
eukprot:GGOE01044307.1.p1 GENE.GGOE01044307.1~~GGOE01044307.1.p1  ORF type:complete len:291 (-),score=99.96 GGOE01044307.1:723-1541(-)